MENLGFLIFLFVMWAVGQALKARENRRGAQGQTARRQPQARSQPRRQTAEEGITLEEWMERVRRGQLPTAQPQAPPQPATAGGRDAEAVLEQWQRQTEQAPRSSGRRTATPPARPDRDAYTTRHEQMQRAAEVERAQADELAKERAREQQAQQRREAERREAALRQHAGVHQTLGTGPRAAEVERAQAQELAQERMREQEALQRREAERREAALRQHAGVHQPMGTRRRRSRRRGAVPQRQRQVVESQQRIEERPATHVQRRVARDSAGRDAYARPSERGSVRARLNLSRDGLRNGILLAEVLGPCVAVRPPQAPSGFARMGEFV